VRFAAVGDVMVDVVSPEMPQAGVRVHTDVSLHAGGSAVNAAAAAVAAGSQAEVIGRIGAGASGELVLAELEAMGVVTRLARDPNVATGVVLALGPADSPSVIARRGANANFSVRDVPESIEADALFVSGFALFQSGSSDAARTAIERFTGDWLGVDLGSPSLATEARESSFGAPRRNTVLLATEAEAQAFTGLGPDEAARTLATTFEVGVVKLGEEGAVAVRGGEIERCQPRRVARRSPFGAGDTFAAVLLVGLAEGASLQAALERAGEAGALSR
jgi:sugar/nucleoside kinase (ribokinase family)